MKHKKLFLALFVGVFALSVSANAHHWHYRHSGLYTALDIVNTFAHVVDVITPRIVVSPSCTTYTAPSCPTTVYTAPTYTAPVVTTPVVTAPVVTYPTTTVVPASTVYTYPNYYGYGYYPYGGYYRSYRPPIIHRPPVPYYRPAPSFHGGPHHGFHGGPHHGFHRPRH